MSAILGAFAQYCLTLIFCVAVAGLGIFCGKKWHDSAEKKKEQESEEL